MRDLREVVVMGVGSAVLIFVWGLLTQAIILG